MEAKVKSSATEGGRAGSADRGMIRQEAIGYTWEVQDNGDLALCFYETGTGERGETEQPLQRDILGVLLDQAAIGNLMRACELAQDEHSLYLETLVAVRAKRRAGGGAA